jgi:hypothetical protein
MSDNDFGPEGAQALSEPLGKLTALQQLELGGTILILIILILGRGCVADEGGRHAWWWALFLTRMSGNDFGPEGAKALSKLLGKLTALHQLDLVNFTGCKILFLIFSFLDGICVWVVSRLISKMLQKLIPDRGGGIAVCLRWALAARPQAVAAAHALLPPSNNRS